ncbi:MAG: hypothetical protein R2709_08805 [Marmoricola sp.]
MLDIAGQQLSIEKHSSSRDRKIRRVDSAVAWQPPSSQVAGDLGDSIVQGVPGEDREQVASRGFLLRSHAHQHFQPGHLARVQRASRARLTKDLSGSGLASEYVDYTDVSTSALIARWSHGADRRSGCLDIGLPVELPITPDPKAASIACTSWSMSLRNP